MDAINRDLHAALDGLDENRRDVLRRMILKSAFVTPIVASFAMAGLTVDAAAVCLTNTTCSGPPIQESDRRLKKDVVRIGTHRLGFGIYCFSYLWSEDKYIGVLAQEVNQVRPDAVVVDPDGFLGVDYSAIGMKMALLTAQQSAAAVRRDRPLA
jgi:hypothetical protein